MTVGDAMGHQQQAWESYEDGTLQVAFLVPSSRYVHSTSCLGKVLW
jgi:hypothetical protein